MSVTEARLKDIPLVNLVSPRHADSWTHTRAGDPRGYIDADALKELWIHTGTACNLACPFCLEGSKPGDTRIPAMTLALLKPFIQEAVEMGVQQFSFTGGEPFVIRDFVSILDYASQHKPCFVLTNGTRVVMQRKHQILPLLKNPNPIHFRVSMDYPDAARHDAGRGEGSFAESVECIRWLHDSGFKVSIARQTDPGEDPQAVEAQFREIFRAHDIPDRALRTAVRKSRKPAWRSTPPATAVPISCVPTPACWLTPIAACVSTPVPWWTTTRTTIWVAPCARAWTPASCCVIRAASVVIASGPVAARLGDYISRKELYALLSAMFSLRSPCIRSANSALTSLISQRS